MMNASMTIAPARPIPNCWIMMLASEKERHEHEDHYQRGGGDDPAGLGLSLVTAKLLSCDLVHSSCIRLTRKTS